ncbi:MAG TPA: DUF1538 domain-containing protein [Gammaproteobacteria bacterium]
MTLLGRMILGTIRDLAPVVLVVLFFQVVVLQQPVARLLPLAEGTLLVVAGLILLVYGLELALFPLGETLANALAQRGSVWFLVSFAFLLGFGTTFAEPALTAVANEAANAAAQTGAIVDSPDARASYAFGLRFVVALSVGAGLTLGVMRIVLGWSLPLMVLGGYALVFLITFVAPPEVVGIAYDSGGVTTSVVTVPLVTALGIGLASSLAGRNPMSDGFGTIALVLLAPMIFVMAYGVLLAWI